MIKECDIFDELESLDPIPEPVCLFLLLRAMSNLDGLTVIQLLSDMDIHVSIEDILIKYEEQKRVFDKYADYVYSRNISLKIPYQAGQEIAIQSIKDIVKINRKYRGPTWPDTQA
jgi:hypothetical protein